MTTIVDPKFLRQELEMQSRGFRALNGPPGAWVMQEFVLREGIDCKPQPLPDRYQPRPPKHCFQNASTLMRKTKLTYVEGFVIGSDLPIPIHHAWTINITGDVIDPTLREPERYAYLGVKFTRDEYTEWTAAGISCSALLDYVGRVRVKRIIGRCPALRDMIPLEYLV